MPQVASGREIISFTSYSPTAQDGETEQINVPLGDGPFGSARGAMLLESGALTSEWRGGAPARPGAPPQILPPRPKRPRGGGGGGGARGGTGVGAGGGGG